MSESGALTREQVEEIHKWFNDPGTCNISTVARRLTDQLIVSHELQRQAIERLEEQWRKTNAQYEASAKAVTRLTTQLQAMTTARDIATRQGGQARTELILENRDLSEHLATAQARVKELEHKLGIVGQDFTANMLYQGQLERRNADLQATLTAREEEIDRLKLAQQHSIQDECEAEQHLIDAGISDYEPGGDGEYRGLLTQIDLCIKQRDAAVQEVGRVREALHAVMQTCRLESVPTEVEQQAQAALKGA